MAVDRALAELDYAPGELSEDQYEVHVLVEPDEGFLGVGGKDAEVEVVLFEEELDELGPRLTADDIEYDFGDEDEEEDEYEPPEAGSARLREFLSVVLGHLRVDAKVHIVETAEEIAAELSGDDLGVVIGKRGQTLDAIEYLASIALYPHPDARKRVEIDAEGYKARRQAAIERIAFRKAQEVTKRGKAVQLEPMTSAERKIVHIALRDRRDVVTESTGREPYRAVIISPSN
jgi:spoIIIJ-associated protein